MGMPILLVDSLNVFLRSYMANPQMDNDGELIGGIVGYMKSLAKLVHDLSPRKVIIVWESGGSPRRLQLYSGYKQRRKPLRPMNRTYGDAIPDTEENKNYQIRTVIKLLKNFPIYQVYVENCEADDVIAYLAKSVYQNEEKVIVSSDKDFYQLLNDKTKIFNPGKKVFVKEEDVIRDFNISPKNFCVAKAFNGDNSDNVPGVPRLGFKTLSKKFDFINEISIDDVVEESKKHVLNDKKPLLMYENIVQNEELVRRNMKIMELDNQMLSFQQIQQIRKIIDEYTPKWKKIKFIKTYKDLNLDGLDIERLCNCFSYLVHT